jgi:flagellar biosynthesis component FlhA
LNKSEERGDKIPALIYSSALWMMAWKHKRVSNKTSESEGNEKEKEKEKESEEQEEETEEIKLGLGDLVFYGILVTRAARLS